ncbi:DEAD/DEAH box helicase [Pedobacter chinensis]|nr:DEAD/DEAH box helicase [Pedobacter chinensis]
MKIHGVFIGIDRYSSEAIPWLSCAKRDAVALFSLFSDNIPGEYKLFYDDSATRANIESAISDLSICSEDDIVIISFSGHGSPEHQLVAHDSDIFNLNESTVPFDRLAELLGKIPARQVFCFIDCCFSGGLGAKALQLDFASRKSKSIEDALNQFSGRGRIVLTASKANEEAWENVRYGHGLLTYYLLQAFQGAQEVRKDGKIGIYKMLEYVTSNVKTSASIIGQQQNPMLLGQIVEEIYLPVFVPGRLYQMAFPELQRSKAESDISSLSGLGFDNQIIDIWKASIPSLNELQLAAINEYGLLEGSHLVVSAPTSSGKTMLGEMAAIFGVKQRKRTIFLFPLKALVNDKLRQFEEVYLPLNIKTIKATGESTSDDIGPLMKGRYDICLMTYEKFTSIVLNCPFILNQVGTIVIDEAQMLADHSRGVNLEFTLTLLKLKRLEGIEPQIITLSAVIGNLNGFERWIGARLLIKKDRPVPVQEGILTSNGLYRSVSSDTMEESNVRLIQPEYRKGTSQDVIIPLVRKLVAEGKSIIVFRETKPEAAACAEYLANNLGLPPALSAMDALPDKDPSRSSQRLRRVLSQGVGFHIADLDPEERNVVEENFRDRASGLKVIAATTTLAMGVNTPADAVVVAGLMHPGDNPYTVAEYKNIIGRAGRLGFSQKGESYLIAMTGGMEHSYWTGYVMASPEDLRSNFLMVNTDVRSLILRVLSATGRKNGMDPEQIISFLEQSFGAFQERLRFESWTWNAQLILKALADLENYQLVHKDVEGFYRSTALGKLAGDSGLLVESIIRVVDCLSKLTEAQMTEPNLLALTQLCVELEEVYMPINKRSTQMEPATWAAEIKRQNIAHTIVSSFSKHANQTADVTAKSKKTIACLIWMSKTSLADIENILMQHNVSSDAAGALRSVVARTCDVLPTVAAIAELTVGGQAISKKMAKLLSRLELGIPAESLEISNILGKAISRGEYLQLLGQRILTTADFNAADEDVLLAILGKDKLGHCRDKMEKKDRENIVASLQNLPEVPLY